MSTAFDGEVATGIGQGLEDKGNLFRGRRLNTTGRCKIRLLGIPKVKVAGSCEKERGGKAGCKTRALEEDDSVRRQCQTTPFPTVMANVGDGRLTAWSQAVESGLRAICEAESCTTAGGTTRDSG